MGEVSAQPAQWRTWDYGKVAEHLCCLVLGEGTSVWASMAQLLSLYRKPVEKSKCLLLSLDEAHSPAAGSFVLLCL